MLAVTTQLAFILPILEPRSLFPRGLDLKNRPIGLLGGTA